MKYNCHPDRSGGIFGVDFSTSLEMTSWIDNDYEISSD
jgi:hypothetical protein